MNPLVAVAQLFGPKRLKVIVPPATPPKVTGCVGSPIDPSPNPPVPGLFAVPVRLAESLIELPSKIGLVLACVESAGVTGVTVKHSVVEMSVGLFGSLEGGTPAVESPE